VVGVCAFSGSLRGLKLVPAKGVASSHPPAGNADRWAVPTSICEYLPKIVLSLPRCILKLLTGGKYQLNTSADKLISIRLPKKWSLILSYVSQETICQNFRTPPYKIVKSNPNANYLGVLGCIYSVFKS
jgi:hypothetical protein